MPTPMAPADLEHLRAAFREAERGRAEGGVPIGAVMVEAGEVIAAGHNRRVQDGDPVAHAEMDCIRRAGRRARYDAVTLVTTLSPCMMCAGAIVQFGIRRVIVGERANFKGNIAFLEQHGIEVALADDPDCTDILRSFIAESGGLWDEDIAGRDNV